MQVLQQPVTDWAVCHDCRKRHGIRARSALDVINAWSDWNEKHRGHRTGLRRAGPAWMRYGDNADAKEAFQAEQIMTVIGLQSLATSPTAGWGSAYVDNTVNLYLDTLVTVIIASVNTAPANSKALFVYAYGGNNSTDLTNTGATGGAPGTEGALTFPDITANPIIMPLVAVIPYASQAHQLNAGPFSIARAFGGILPPYWGVAIVNHSGMTLATTGNNVKYRGVYSTVI